MYEFFILKEELKLNGKKVRLITEILLVIVICLVSFVGVYKQEGNKMENKVKWYSYSKDLEGYRELIFKVSDATQVVDKDGKVVGNTDNYSDSSIESYSYTKTENVVNKEENLTEENYKTSKEVIEKRLKKLGVEDYNLSQDTENGTIYLQIPENSDTDHTISNILELADFKIADSKDSSKVFLTNKDIKKASSVYNTETSGTTVYLQIEFNKDGKEVLKEISSGEYATNKDTENETKENNTESENLVEAEAEVATEQTETQSEEEKSENSQKEITLSIGNNSMITSSFEEPMETGIINLSMGSASKDADTINDSMKSTSTIAVLLNSGALPITYKVDSNRYVKTDIKSDMLNKAIYVIAAVIIVAILYLVLKYKLKGLIAGIAYVGLLSLYLLLIRYTNVQVAIESIVATVVILIINYELTLKLLKISKENEESRKKLYNEELKNTIIKLIPILLTSIVFVYTKWTTITIFGMFMFWGIILIVIYNFLLTKDMIEDEGKESE